jgi:glutathione S-transferase
MHDGQGQASKETRMFQLYDFTFSHYCEKARWALDFKGVAYTPHHLLPGFHMLATRKIAPLSCLPILTGEGIVVQDSTQIINFLEQRFPDPSLTPADPNQANEAIEWEEYLDEEIGLTLRRWFYFHTLPDRRRAMRFLCGDASGAQRVLFGFAFAPIRRAMTAMMDIHPESAKEAERRFLIAFDKLDNALTHRDFLVGDRFSRADLTACALLSPFCRPGEGESQLPGLLAEPVCALRDRLKHRRFYHWVCDMYRQQRTPARHRDAGQTRAAGNAH